MPKINFNGVVREMTTDEIAALEKSSHIAKIEQSTRPLTVNEVTTMLITSQVNTLPVDDNTALCMKEFYPKWEPGINYTNAENRPIGYKVSHSNNLWKLRSEHTSQIGWEPGTIGTESLWEQVNGIHSGAIDDPILYNGNMALNNGLHYYQNGVIYICNRDTVNPVYHTLAELVGLYVVEV